MIYKRISEIIERRMPDLSERPMQIAQSQLADAWKVPAADFHEMAVKQRKGTIMGRVQAVCWRAAGRIYYRVRGPESPQEVSHNGENGDANNFVFCEAEYRDEQSLKVERFSRGGGVKLWKFNGQAAARGTVAAGRYRIESENNYVAITFWTPESEQAETVRFCYRENWREGYMDFRPHLWQVSNLAPTSLEAAGGRR